jgi:hypothetical protein
MKKVISMSVWGTEKRYRTGIIENVELAKIHFPEWEIYLHTNIENLILSKYNNLKIFQVRPITNNPLWEGLFWRFLPFFKIDGYVLSRDTDARLSEREKIAVNEWITSGKKFNIIRDHIRHFDFPILGGMWGAKTPLNSHLSEKMKIYQQKNCYLSDQEFLAMEIWPIALNDSFIHDIISDGWLKESRQSIGKKFIGQGYDENNNPIYPE